MRSNWIICTIALWSNVGCVLAQTTTAHRQYRLSDVRKIIPGITKKSEILALFGKPDREINLKDIGPILSDNDEWSYEDDATAPVDRMSVEFPPKSNVVIAVNWAVEKKEREAQLDVAKQIFPGATFKMQPYPQINPHTVDHRCFYKDERLGVLIIYDDLKKGVTSISWMEPKELTRTTALENFRYPEFCMGGNCSHSSPEIERKLSGEKK